jgi:aminoglycoside 6'-N-acetyltransferase I
MTSQTEFRLLGADDASVLERVDPDVFDGPLLSASCREFLDGPENLLVVAIQDDVVVGMASGLIYIHPDKPRELFVNEVGVAARCQRQGIASRLVSLLLEHGQRAGCAQAWVATEENNLAANALYASLGGNPDEERAVVYSWRLRDPIRS